tara:strand:- start:1047 stop:1397 length:351 start_codon:yes stop_codon:yes gene_type:complete
MSKKQINYSDLSTKELELLKEIYIDSKVKSMSHNDLINFAIENISVQVNNTIGNDEELEAWSEMEEFFKDEFENTIADVQIKIRSKTGKQNNLKNEELNPKIEEEAEDKKIDMWED